MARTITLKFAGTCTGCGTRIPRGSIALWTGRGRVRCQQCAVDEPDWAALGYSKGTPSSEDYECSDMGYEDACARAVGY